MALALPVVGLTPTASAATPNLAPGNANDGNQASYWESTTTRSRTTGYSFDGNANTVTINFGATNTGFVRLNFTANTGWPAGQVSEFEVYGPTTASANPALGRTATASSFTQILAPTNATDCDQAVRRVRYGGRRRAGARVILAW